MPLGGGLPLPPAQENDDYLWYHPTEISSVKQVSSYEQSEIVVLSHTHRLRVWLYTTEARKLIIAHFLDVDLTVTLSTPLALL